MQRHRKAQRAEERGQFAGQRATVACSGPELSYLSGKWSRVKDEGGKNEGVFLPESTRSNTCKNCLIGVPEPGSDTSPALVPSLILHTTPSPRHALAIRAYSWFPNSNTHCRDPEPSQKLPSCSSWSVWNVQVNCQSQATLSPPLPGHPRETSLPLLLCSHCVLSTSSSSSAKSLHAHLPIDSKLLEGRALCLVFSSIRCSINIYR